MNYRFRGLWKIDCRCGKSINGLTLNLLVSKGKQAKAREREGGIDLMFITHSFSQLQCDLKETYDAHF